MPLPSDVLSLSIAGVSHADWTTYEIDSDLLTPADAWRVSLGGAHALPDAIQPGADCVIRYGADTVMVGVVDEITEQLDKRGHSISLSGRDMAGQLLDCSAPVFNELQVSLERILKAICDALKINNRRIDAVSTQMRHKVSTTPGQTSWEVLQNAAEANGLWPWFDPSGTLILGRPDVPKEANATLVLSRDNPTQNNVLSATYTRSLHDVYSEVRILGQAAGADGARAMRGVWGSAPKDKPLKVTWGNGAAETPLRHRPKISTDYESDNPKVAELRANKELADGLLKSKCVKCTVRGHRTDEGVMWTPGMRVSLKLDALGVTGVWLLMSRTLRGGRDGGTVTELTLYQDGLWQINAHPHSRVQRKAKLAAAASGAQP
jgi:prophage tail gpP-like protein